MNNQTIIKVIDAPMGSGKTSWAIDYINKPFRHNNNFMYVTPLLSETKRIKEKCVKSKRGFYLPKAQYKKENGTNNKTNGLYSLINNDEDIATTHNLLLNITNEHRQLIKRKNYTLFLDEVIQPIESFQLKKKNDIKYLEEKQSIKINTNGRIEWIEDIKNIQYDDFRILCNNRCLYAFKDNSNNSYSVISVLPPELFTCFSEIYILTYNFKNSILYHYFKAHNINFELCTLSSNKEVIPYQTPDTRQYRKLIKLYDNVSVGGYKNDLVKQKENSALSKSWFYASYNKNKVITLKNSIYNFLHNLCKANSNNIMWTTFKDKVKLLKNKGYSSKNCFCPCNCVATNEYGNRHYLVYGLNYFPTPMIRRYFEKIGYNLPSSFENGIALNTLLQWVFRSAIRNNEKIHLYLPSNRMYNLMKKWLE